VTRYRNSDQSAVAGRQAGQQNQRRRGEQDLNWSVPCDGSTANTTFSAHAPFAARQNMPVLYSSVPSQAFLHPSLCCKARNRQITPSFTPARGWRISMFLMQPSPPYQPPAPVVLGHEVVQMGTASLPHDSSFLPFFHSLTIIIQTEGGEEAAT